MADHIPFVTGEDVANLVPKIFGDSGIVRVSLGDKTKTFISALGPKVKLWIDPSFDGCDDIASRESTPTRQNSWYELIKLFPHFDKLRLPTFLAKPVQSQVDAIVQSMLDKTLAFNPTAITVPQFPVCDGSERNKINVCLARATAKWRNKVSYGGKLILPLVFTHQRQSNKKTARNAKVIQAEKCFVESNSDGFWVVDKNMADDQASPNLVRKRFSEIIELHTELNGQITSHFKIGGPYWGLNLVLWAKGLIDFPGIGVGTGYQFYLSGGFAKMPSAKIAIGPLRRRVTVTPQLAQWLDDAIAATQKNFPGHPAIVEFKTLKKNLPLYNDAKNAREQVATFYKTWFDDIAASSPAMRRVALFKDLSDSYVLGKCLPPMLSEKAARSAEAIVEPLMLNCL